MNFISSYNLMENKIPYLWEMKNGKILAIENSRNINILEIKDNNRLELYQKIETNERQNFVGTEISNKYIITGGRKILSIIKPTLLNKYSLKKSINLDSLICNIVSLDSKSFLVGHCYSEKICIYSNEYFQKIFEISKIASRANNYSISKISKDLVGIAGEEMSKGCIFIISIKKRIIFQKILIDDMKCCNIVIGVNNNYLVTIGDGSCNYTDLIFFKMEKNNNDIRYKKINHIKRAYEGLIEGLIAFDNHVIANDTPGNLIIWRIEEKRNNI